MANRHYPKGKEKMLQAQINWLTDTIKAVLVKGAYTYSDAHEFLTDLGANVLGTNQALASRTITNGVLDAADVEWLAVTAGDTASFVVLIKDTGVAATSPLLSYIDTLANFPFTTNGGDIKVQWDNGISKIFTL